MNYYSRVGCIIWFAGLSPMPIFHLGWVNTGLVIEIFMLKVDYYVVVGKCVTVANLSEYSQISGSRPDGPSLR